MRALINSKAKSIGRIKDIKKIAAWMRTTYSRYCTVKKIQSKKINDQKGAIIIAEKKTYIFMQSTTTRKL